MRGWEVTLIALVVSTAGMAGCLTDGDGEEELSATNASPDVDDPTATGESVSTDDATNATDETSGGEGAPASGDGGSPSPPPQPAFTYRFDAGGTAERVVWANGSLARQDACPVPGFVCGGVDAVEITGRLPVGVPTTVTAVLRYEQTAAAEVDLDVDLPTGTVYRSQPDEGDPILGPSTLVAEVLAVPTGEGRSFVNVSATLTDPAAEIGYALRIHVAPSTDRIPIGVPVAVPEGAGARIALVNGSVPADATWTDLTASPTEDAATLRYAIWGPRDRLVERTEAQVPVVDRLPGASGAGDPVLVLLGPEEATVRLVGQGDEAPGELRGLGWQVERGPSHEVAPRVPQPDDPEPLAADWRFQVGPVPLRVGVYMEHQTGPYEASTWEISVRSPEGEVLFEENGISSGRTGVVLDTFERTWLSSMDDPALVRGTYEAYVETTQIGRPVEVGHLLQRYVR